jgi:DNA-binding beta-propeller fold protein YncE
MSPTPSIGTTRRGFVGGALAAAAAPALARPGEAAAGVTFSAKREILRRGRAIAAGPRGRVLVVAHERRRTIAIVRGRRERILDVGGQPVEVAVSPDGRLAAVTTASWDEPGLAIVDLTTFGVRKRIAVGPAPSAVAFSPDGRHVLVTGGEQEGTLHLVDVARTRVLDRTRVGLVPRGLAVAPGGDAAWVALNADDRVVRVDLRRGRVARAIKTEPHPDRVAIDRRGERLLVSHGGRESVHVSEIEIDGGRVRRHRAGRLVSGVAWTRDGRAVAAVGGTGKFVVFGRAGRRARALTGAPRGLAIAGDRAYSVGALNGEIESVRL